MIKAIISLGIAFVNVQCNDAFAVWTGPTISRSPSGPPPQRPQLHRSEKQQQQQQGQLFALSHDELISLTKEYLNNLSPDYWDDDEFVFRGPVIGPLVKKDIINTVGSVTPEDSFTNFTSNAFGFSVDPIEPNRVWWFERARGTFSRPYDHPVFGLIEPNNKDVIAPPEARSVIWKESNKKIKYMSVGYVTDRFTNDTTNGMGAIFGLMHHMGIQIDGDVGSPITVFLQWLSSVLPEGSTEIPKSYSNEDDIPAWWTDIRRGAQK